MIITPGYTFTSTEAVTAAKLNQLGSPTGTREQADLDAAVDEVQTQLGTGVARPNYFRNPGLDVWTRGTTAVSCAVGTRQLRADDWWTRTLATSADLPTYLRVPNAAQNFLYAAQIVGATGVGAVDFGQDLPARISALFTPNITVTFTIANGTAAALTPLVRLDTCDVAEVYSAVTNAASVAVSAPVASGATTTVSVTLSLSGAAAALRRGALLYIRIPSGGLDSTIKNVSISALKVEDGTTASANIVERDPVDPADVSVADRDFLFNGGMDSDRWVNTNATCAAGLDTFGPMGWWTNPSAGSTMTVSRLASAPTGTTSTTHAALLTGSAATSGTVDFGQNIESKTATRLARQCVFSAWIYNNTGAAITPQLRIDTCTAADVFSAVSNQESQNAVSCANGAWTKVTLAFDGSSYTNLANGCRIYVRFIAGVLDDPAATVRIAQAKLELGAVASAYEPPAVFEPGNRTGGADMDLAIVGSAATLAITCSNAVLRETSGLIRTTGPISVTINAAVNGVNGLDTGTVTNDTNYFVWLIGNRTTVAGLLSTSDTAPTLPAGYTYRECVGWTRYISSAFPTFQRGRSVRYATRALFATIAGTAFTTSYTSVLTAAGLAAGYLAPFGWPGKIARLHGLVFKSATSPRYMALAANTAGLGETLLKMPEADAGFLGNGDTAFALTLLPATNQDFAAKVTATATVSYSMSLTGFDF